jgi:transmembrane sensor
MAGGELSDVDRMELDLWLEADPIHPRLLANAVEAWRATKEQASEPEMLALRREALADARRAKTLRRRRAFALWAAAAMVLIGIALGGIWMLGRPTTYVTGVGERRIVILPDGSGLSLDAVTLVKVRYTADRRQFWLERGRAKFDVAKNPLVPFTVAVNGMLVVATGTQFSTEILPQQVRVDLYEGHVAVLNQRHPDAQYLAPGEELIATTTQGTQGVMGTVRALSPADAPVWEGGQLVFVDERLAVVAERANRYSDKKIVIADKETSERRISGVFTAGNTAAIVSAITTLLPVLAAENRAAVISLSLDRSRTPAQIGGVRSAY